MQLVEPVCSVYSLDLGLCMYIPRDSEYCGQMKEAGIGRDGKGILRGNVYLTTGNIRGRTFGQEMEKYVPRIKSRPVWLDRSE